MKIEISITTDEYGETHEMSIDGKDSIRVAPLCECPEDAIIERDLIGCVEIADLMKAAHGAGSRGEEFSISVTKE